MNAVPKFGRSRSEQTVESAGPHYISPRDLPGKGICYHANHLRRLVKDKKFPAPIRLSPRRIVWREADIDRWIEQKSQETQGAE